MTTLKQIQRHIGVPADGVWGDVTARSWLGHEMTHCVYGRGHKDNRHD